MSTIWVTYDYGNDHTEERELQAIDAGNIEKALFIKWQIVTIQQSGEDRLEELSIGG
jgi:hypothetical protein